MTSPASSLAERPVVRLRANNPKKRAKVGHPWIFANEIQMNAAAKQIPPGEVVRVETEQGKALGTYVFNKKPLICARLLTVDADARIDAGFFADRLRRARDLRDRLIGTPHYRLAHAEADGFPGAVIDRFGDVFVVQINTAGMERLTPELLTAMESVFSPRAIVLRNDGASREQEGLHREVRMGLGELDGPIPVLENGAHFRADPREGQKTGWFFDQRDNRAFVAQLAKGCSVYDAYSYTGGFAVQAALGGAASVIAVDRSETALDKAREAAELNGVDDRFSTVESEVFADLEARHKAGQTFDIVVTDPPAFVKAKKDYWQGVKAYRKLARMAARLVAPRGILVCCSCSHHVEAHTFGEQIRRGLEDVGRGGRILRFAGAGPDHPIHPWLPETGYLKCQALTLD
ncbi:23S rRNA (cytosine1962-C5)-methyltransferase [Limimonas halophila]|uniref:23S rRNA (Cytosine1962-C5)-methyltransferase n=1 Tax=Limimonas halophila TaxID=1082479 RepID=A0A1G7TDD2_9PROT|nr:class I SAM-dependent rRNA methyltransferase [Limimonas halophila]SDG33377.1 23S rRNA (cytosine1962-C5)-methyltransferase [Limimonas halophila]